MHSVTTQLARLADMLDEQDRAFAEMRRATPVEDVTFRLGSDIRNQIDEVVEQLTPTAAARRPHYAIRI